MLSNVFCDYRLYNEVPALIVTAHHVVILVLIPHKQ